MEASKPEHDDGLYLRRALIGLLPCWAVADAAQAQDAARVQPDSYRVVLDNAELRVLEFVSRPGMGVCGTGMHSHPPHLTMTVTAAKVRVKLPDGKEFIGENKPGDVFWSPAETHSTENISGREVRALIVELKGRKG